MTRATMRLALACAVAACLASAADAQLGGYTNSTYAKSLSLKLAKTQLLTIQSPPQVCALPVSDESMGSVFARLKEDASTLSAVMSLRTGGTYPIPITDLEGPVPWLLGTWFPNQGNVTFSYVAVKLDSHTVQMSDRTAVALAAMTAINATCVLDAIVVDTNVSSLFRLSSPIAAYGYQVVTPRPHLHEQTTLQQIWLWTQPYSWPVWIVVVGIFLTTAFVVAMFDIDHRHTKDTDFLDNVPIMRNVAHFLYLSAVTLTGHGSFKPYSAAGRLYIMAKAFCLLILWSCYRAALTAYFVTPPTPIQPISTITDFLSAFGTGTPACIGSDPASKSFFQYAYPEIATMQLADGGTEELLHKVESGECTGAVAPSDELMFYLGHEDHDGEFCHLETKDYLGHYMRAIPFNPAIVGQIDQGYDSPAWFDGFFRIECKATQDLNLSNYKEKWFPSQRPMCAAEEEHQREILKQEVEGVSIVQVIGIFVIQALGFLFGFVLHLRDTLFPSTLEHDMTMHLVPQEELDNELRELENMAEMLNKHKAQIEQAAIVAGQGEQLRAMQARHSQAEATHVQMMAARMSLHKTMSNLGRVGRSAGGAMSSNRTMNDFLPALPKRGSKQEDGHMPRRGSRPSDGNGIRRSKLEEGGTTPLRVSKQEDGV